MEELIAKKLIQKEDLITIHTPLGDGVFKLVAFHGSETLSHPFKYQLELRSENNNINHSELLGQQVNVGLKLEDGDIRNFNGYVSQFSMLEERDQFTYYHATIVPSLWFLNRTADCRIFQEMTVPEIIAQVLSQYDIINFDMNLIAQYRAWEYCVQYRESDFAFINRLMEQEGIYYFFRHTEDNHTLILADDYAAHEQIIGNAQLTYRSGEFAIPQEYTVSTWRVSQSIQPGTFTHTDYNYEHPQLNLQSTYKSMRDHALADFEIYDYPGEYTSLEEGDNYSRIRMEAYQTEFENVHAKTNAHGLGAGVLFGLNGHPRDDQNREYLVLSAHYKIGTADEGARRPQKFQCQFTALESSTPYRSPRKTPLPIVRGPQTAVVVGPAGEEIYTDEYGRVKVQFHWDREGEADDNSSSWLRVAQSTTGNQWGMISIPRLGEEVIVSFIEGDPDRPIITGRVYNGDRRPPYDLPAQKTVTGIKTDSSIGGGGYNEYIMDDSKGSELIREHAQFDKDSTIEHDLREQIVNDVSRDVGQNQTITIGKNKTETVGARSSENIGVAKELNIGAAYQVTVGAAKTENIGGSKSVSVGSSSSETVAKNKTHSIGSNFTLETGKTVVLTASKNMNLASGENLSVKTGKKALLEVADEISIKCGKASIKMKKNGDIDIRGRNISIKGTGNITIKGKKVIYN